MAAISPPADPADSPLLDETLIRADARPRLWSWIKFGRCGVKLESVMIGVQLFELPGNPANADRRRGKRGTHGQQRGQLGFECSKAPGVSYGSWRRELAASGALEPMLFMFGDTTNMPHLPRPEQHCVGLWRAEDALYMRICNRGVIGTSDDGRMEKVDWDKAEAAGLSKTDPRWNNPEKMTELQRCDLVARLLPMVSPKEADRTVQRLHKRELELLTSYVSDVQDGAIVAPFVAEEE